MDPPAMMKHSVLRSGSSGNESYNLTEMCHFQCGQMLGQLMDNYPIGENSLMADQNGLRKQRQSHSKRLKTSKRSRDEDSVERPKHAEKSWKQIEAPKQDYIHVRARRGEATDSHSLAERARRKKISERMKILQELVPGCNKVIGKALLLDEIINYIHSLQQQVDFLSMKVEAVNSRLEPGTQEFPSNFSSRQTYNTGVLTFGFGSHALGEYGKGKGS